jgi:DNA-binding CsgD family transcriptional regulator
MGLVCPPLFATDADELVARATAELGDAFGPTWREGAALDWQTAVVYAGRTRRERRRQPFGWDSLTPSELQVVELVAAGLTTPQISERLFVSPSTIKTHLSHVFAKLGVTTRSELAAAASRHAVS